MSGGAILLGILASIITGAGLMFTISRSMSSSKKNRHKQSIFFKKAHNATLIAIISMLLLGLVFAGITSLYLIYADDTSSVRYFDAVFYSVVLTSSIYYVSEVVLMFLHSLFKSIRSKFLNNK